MADLKLINAHRNLFRGWHVLAKVAVFLALVMGATTHAHAQAAVAYSSSVVAGGDGDGFYDANECNAITIRIRNSGTVALSGISATLSSNTFGVFITQPNTNYPDLAVGVSADSSVAFQVSTSNSFVPANGISFVLNVSTAQGNFSVPFAAALPAAVTTRFDNSTAVAIPDSPRPGQQSTLNSTVNVTGLTGTISTVNVLLHTTHARDGDLVFTLVAPDGTSVLLVNKRGGNGNNFGSSCTDAQRTTLIDSAAGSVTAATAPFVGSFRPEQPLSLLQNKTAAAMNGTWTLRVNDTKRNNVGTLNCWSLRISTVPLGLSNGACAGAPSADVSVTKTASAPAIANGTNVTYTLVVRNQGPSAATSVTVRDPLPASLTYGSATSTHGSFTQSNGLVTFNLGSLAANATSTCTITATANTAGAITNTATVLANESDTVAANNSSSVITYIQTIADLAVTNVDSPDPVLTNNTVTYTMVVSNAGPEVENNAALNMAWPVGGQFVSATSTSGTVTATSGETAVLNIGGLDVGANVTVNLVLRPTACGSFTNTATLSRLDSDPVLSNNTVVQTTTVNDAAPTVSISAPNYTATATGPVSYTITYTGATTVNLPSASVVLNRTGTANGTVTVLGSGNSTRTVVISSITGTGTIGISLPAGTATSCTTPAPAAGPSATFTVDPNAPFVNSINRANANPTNATLVNYTVTFNQNVTGVTAANFSTVTSGVSATVGTVTGSGAVYNVPVTVSGSGTVRLNLDQNLASITNGIGTPMSVAFTTGQVYNVDNVVPTVQSFTRLNDSPTSLTSVAYQLVFSEPVTGVAASNFTFAGSGVTGVVGTPTTSNNTTWTIPLFFINGNGTFNINLNQNLASLLDGAGNALAAGMVAPSYSVDQAAPAVTSITRVGGATTNATNVSFTVVFTEPVTGFSATNLSLAGTGVTGTIGVPTTADNITWTVPVSSVAGNGTLGLNVDQGLGSIIDALGNPMSVAFTTGELFTVDQDVPTVISIVRSSANPTNATTVGYTVQFSETVSGVSAGNFSLTGSGVTGVIGAPSTSDGITWTVSITSVAGNGTLALDLNQSLSSIVDGAANPLAAGLSGEVYTVDQQAPTVVAITRSGSSPTNATTLGFTIQFSEAVSGLAAGSFSLSGAGVTGTIGAPTTSDGITWLVDASGVSGSGTLGLDLTNGAGVTDAVGNVVTGLPSVGELYAVDQGAPTVVSLVRADTNPTNAVTLGFTLTFSEAVTGVDVANLSLTGSGVTGSISTPTSGDGGVTWNVSVTGVAGDGTLGLDLAVATGITDATGNALAASFMGELYTVDQTAPTVTSFTRSGGTPSSATNVAFTLVFSEPVSGLTAANLALAGAGATGTIGVPTTGDGGLTWTIPVTAVSGDGSLGLTLQDGASIVDAAGNALAGAPIASELYTIDQTAPTVASLTRGAASPTKATTLGFVLTFSEPVSGVDASAFTLTGAGVAGTIDTVSTSDSGLTWNISVISVAGDGTLGLDLTNGAAITDASANNPTNVPFVGEVYQVDQTAPQVVSVVRADANPTGAASVNWTITFSEPVAGLTAANLSLVPSGVASSISSVTTADGLTWNVAAVVAGTGTVGLDVSDGTGVTDPAGNVITGLPVVGEIYTVNQPAPVVLSISRLDADPTNATTVNFAVIFNEAVTGVTAGAFTLNVSGVTGVVGTPTTADNITWSVPVNTVSGDGSLGLKLTNETGIQNGISTQLAAGPYAGEVYTIDQTAPTIVSLQRAGANPTNASTLTFTVTFDEAVTNVTPANFTLNAAGVTGTIAAATAVGDGTAWSIDVTGVAGDGTLGVDLSAPAGIADLAGNALATTLVGETYDVDQTAPSITSITRLDANPTNATTVRFNVLFSEAVTGVNTSNFGLAATGVSANIATPTTTDGGVNWEVALISVSGDGTLGLDLVDATGIADAASNSLTGAPFTGEVYDVDQTRPTVSSFTPVHPSPTNASVLSFQVVFSEPVSSLPIAALQVSGSGVTATITAPASTDGGLTWDIPVMDVAGDGTLSLTIVDGTLVSDAAGNTLSGTPAISDEYTIDQTPPAVTSIVRTGSNPTNATTVGFTITFNEPVTGVDAVDLALNATGVTGVIDTPSTSDGGLTWSVNVNSVAGDGTLGLDVTGTTITDAAGNDLAFVPVVGEQYTIDQTPPQVTSLTRAGANPTNAATVSFTLVFDEAVTGLTPANLALTGSGVSATIDAPTTSDGITWTVTLSGVSGAGTLGVDVVDGTGVADLAGNPLTAVPFVGELYTIDQQAPTLNSIARMDANPTNATSVRWLVTFNEPVTGVSISNFALTASSVAAALSSASTSDGGVTWEVTATGVAGNGTLQLDLSDATGITDASGTALATATLAGEAYDIDQTNPTVQAITLLDPNPTNATSLNFGITFSEPVSGLTAAAFTFSGTGVTATFGAPTTSDGITWTVPATSVSGNGTLSIDMVDGSLVLDAAGNPVTGLPYWGPVYTIDQDPPTILSITREDPNPTNATSLTFLLTFSEHVTGITPANLQLSGTGVTGTIGWPVIVDTNTWSVTVESVTGDGTLGLDLVDPTGITGDIGNPLTNTMVGELYDVDQTAPTAVSITRTDSNPTNASSVGFSVVFSEPVNGIATSTFVLSGTGVTGTIGAPSTTDDITWTVQVTGVTGSGTLGIDIPVGTAVTDAAGNPLANALAGEQYDVDQDAPVVQSIVRTDPNPSNATTLNFLVTFSDAVSGVAAGNFALSGTGVTGTMGGPATSDGGITWTIAVTGVTGAGTIGIDLTSGAGITDSLGNALANTLVGEQYTIDQVAPTIVSITRTDTNPTNSATLGFLATFDEPVSGVTAAAFALTGTSGTGTIGNPTSSDGGLTWQIAVTGVSASGTLGLDLVTVAGIVDQAGQTLQNTMVGEQYTIVQDPPTVDSITRTDANPTNATTLGFSVVFSKVVVGVTAANFTLSGTGVTATIGTPTTADGNTWTVQLTTVAGTGTVGLDLSDATGITDSVGNPLANTLAGEQYDVDQTAPEVAAINLLDPNPTTAASVNFEVVFTEAVSGFNVANLALSGAGVTATINAPTTTDNITWNVNLTLTGGSGTIGIDVVDGTGVIDEVGNVLTNLPFVGPTYTICPVLPAPANPVPADLATTHSQISMLTWDPVPGATNYDVYLDGVLTSSTTEAYVLTSAPLTGGLHQWRVDVLDGCSVTTGNTWTFNVLDAVENPTPGEGNRQCEPPTQFTWPAAIGASSYIVIIDGVQVGFTSNTYWDIAPPLSNGTHTWQIISTNAWGNVPSETWTFHILPGGMVDPNLWRAVGQVHAIATQGNIMYIAGNFNYVRSPDGSQVRRRDYIAAIDLTTGAPTDWTANTNNVVHALAVSGGTLYAGGTFTQVTGLNRTRVAAIDTATTNVLDWAPAPNATVRAIAADGTGVYIGGDFTSISGTARSRVARLSLPADGPAVVQAWNPAPDQPVHALLTDSTHVYVGGTFNLIGGQPLHGVAAVRCDTGAAEAWPHTGADLYVYALARQGTTLYAGGFFNTMGGQPRKNLAALDLTTGNVTPWNPGPDRAVTTIVPTPSTIYIGGFFDTVAGQNRKYVAMLDTITGQVEPCTFDTNNVVRALNVSLNVLFAGGDFSLVGQQGVMGFAGFGSLNITPSGPSSVAGWEQY